VGTFNTYPTLEGKMNFKSVLVICLTTLILGFTWIGITYNSDGAIAAAYLTSIFSVFAILFLIMES